jgi:hypothetical protein
LKLIYADIAFPLQVPVLLSEPGRDFTGGEFVLTEQRPADAKPGRSRSLKAGRRRMNWQKASGYNKRSKVEAAISRYKRIIGDTLKSRHDARRATEVAIAVKTLNRMNELGRAGFVRMA